MVKLIRNLIIFIIFLLLAGVGFFLWDLEHSSPSRTYSSFLDSLAGNEVAKIHLKGGKVDYSDTYGRLYNTFSPDVEGLMDKIEGRDILVSAEPGGFSPLVASLVSTLPIIFILLIWFFFVRQMQAGKSAEFSEKKMLTPSTGGTQVTFDDVAGIREAKEELVEIVEFLQSPAKFTNLGARIPKGVLLQGPPGTGKTLLAKAIAGESGVPFFSMSGSDFVEMFVGVGASRVRDLFQEAKKKSPCIVFIDEIDAVGGHRASGSAMGGQDERGQTLNALLVEMDGYGSEHAIIVLGATNRPDILDPALMRPGRFDRQITILPPDVKGRMHILQVHAARVALGEDVDLGEIARSTPGFTGADLGNLVNEAALMAARLGKTKIDIDDFEMAKDRIIMGVERKGLAINEQDRNTTAYHEAGHAIVTRFLPGTDPLHKITIIPRGTAMGFTQQIQLNDRNAYSKQYLLNRIAILMGGRAAEEIIFNQQSTGAQDDLKRATTIASKMVCEWGMSAVVGPLAYASEADGFLGGTGGTRNFSEETSRHIDREIRKIVEDAYSNAVAILDNKKSFLENLADLLLINETLDSEELDIIFECSEKKLQEQESSEVDKEAGIHDCSTCPSGSYCTMRK